MAKPNASRAWTVTVVDSPTYKVVGLAVTLKLAAGVACPYPAVADSRTVAKATHSPAARDLTARGDAPGDGKLVVAAGAHFAAGVDLFWRIIRGYLHRLEYNAPLMNRASWDTCSIKGT